MKCPHCTVEIHEDFQFDWVRKGVNVGKLEGSNLQWATSTMACPACSKAIIDAVMVNGGSQTRYRAYPKSPSRARAAVEVPPDLAEDFNEACFVIEDSAKASAALSRRCLQALLRGQGYAQHDLAKAIDAALGAKALPGALADNLDAIRNIGNFAAHSMKDTNSGAILPVEPHEAEWNLEVLEGLFDYFYVQPAKDKLRRAALNAKLSAAGKPALKQ